jgi:hypothetical protein
MAPPVQCLSPNGDGNHLGGILNCLSAFGSKASPLLGFRPDGQHYVLF